MDQSTKPVVFPPPRLSPEQALDIASRVSGQMGMSNCQCTSGSFSVDPLPADFDSSQGNRCLQHHLIEKDFLGVQTEFRMHQKLAVSNPEPDDDQLGIRIQATFTTTFTSPEALELSDRVVYAKVQALLVSWPYWREFLQSSGARLGLPMQLHLGLLMPMEAARLAGFDVKPGEAPKP